MQPASDWCVRKRQTTSGVRHLPQRARAGKQERTDREAAERLGAQRHRRQAGSTSRLRQRRRRRYKYRAARRMRRETKASAPPQVAATVVKHAFCSLASAFQPQLGGLPGPSLGPSLAPAAGCGDGSQRRCRVVLPRAVLSRTPRPAVPKPVAHYWQLHAAATRLAKGPVDAGGQGTPMASNCTFSLGPALCRRARPLSAPEITASTFCQTSRVASISSFSSRGALWHSSSDRAGRR